jgi:hypothetical protein
VPSKTLIKSRAIAYEMRNAQRWALAPADPQPILRGSWSACAKSSRDRADDSPERLPGPRRRRHLRRRPLYVADAFEVNGGALTAKDLRDRDRLASRGATDPGHRRFAYLTNETVFDLREPVAVAHRRRQRPDRLRAGAGVPAAGQRSHRRRHRIARVAARGDADSPPWCIRSSAGRRHPLLIRHDAFAK